MKKISIKLINLLIILILILTLINETHSKSNSKKQTKNKSNNSNTKDKEKQLSIDKGSILLACSMLGKHVQETSSLNKKFSDIVEVFSLDYDYDRQQSYNILNLMMLRNCVKSLSSSEALEYISRLTAIDSSALRHLQIDLLLNSFKETNNKEVLLDELDELNNELNKLNDRLNELSKNRDKKKTDENKEMNNKKNINRGSGLDASKFNTNTDTINKHKAFNNQKTNKRLNEERVIDKENDVLYWILYRIEIALAFIYYNILQYPEISIGILMFMIISAFNFLFKKKNIKKTKTRLTE